MYSTGLGRIVQGVETFCPGPGVPWPRGAVPASGDPTCYEVPYTQDVPEPRIVDSRVSPDGRKITYTFDDGHVETTDVNDPKYLDMIENQGPGDPPSGPLPVDLELEYTTAGMGMGPLAIMLLLGVGVLAFTRPREPRRRNRGTRGMS